MLADRHKVPIKAAALQFSLAHPASAAVIPGASRPERIKEDHTVLKAKIPDDFWRDLRKQQFCRGHRATADQPIEGRLSMAQASASIELPVSPDQVWQLFGGFGSQNPASSGPTAKVLINALKTK